MIQEATVDAYDESEQATGWFTMLEEFALRRPFSQRKALQGAAVASAPS